MNQTVNECDENLYQPAQIEEDVPFDDDKFNTSNKNDIEETMLNEDIEDRKLNRIIREKLTNWCFTLILVCVSIIIFLYIVDIILVNNNLKNSDLLNSTFELAKSAISILVGFLFAKTNKK